MSDTTPFAGLLALLAGEPLDQRFLHDNIFTIDRLLRVGAVTHRHDGHAALADPPPDVPLAVEVDPTGGTIPADTGLYIAYTWLDADGGETLPSDSALVTTAATTDPPTDAPTVEVVHTGGDLLADTYTYGLTFTDGAGGETILGGTVTVTVDPGYPNSSIILTGMADILAASGAAAWRLYRAKGAGNFTYLATGTGDTITDDDTLCPHCDTQPPLVSTTASTNRILVTLPAGPWPTGVAALRLYGSVDGSFEGSCWMGDYTPDEAGSEQVFTALNLLDGAPPAVSLSMPGANKIDPDVELIDWHWKRPVTTAADLPTDDNGAGDIRMVLDSGIMYRWDDGGATWEALPFGHAVQDEGVDLLNQRSKLNFTGAGVVAQDNAGDGSTDIVIPGGYRIIVKPDGTAMTARSKLKLIGSGVGSVTDDAAGDQTIVNLPGGGGGGGAGGPLGTFITWTDDLGDPAVELRADSRLDQIRSPGTVDISSLPDGTTAYGSYDALGGELMPHVPPPGTSWATLDRNEHLSGFYNVTWGRAGRGIYFPNNTSIYRLGIGFGGGQLGIFAWVKKYGVGDWRLQIVYRIDASSAGGNNDDGYVVLGEAALPSDPVVADTYYWMTLIQNDDDTVEAKIEEGKTVTAEIAPVALPDGTGGTDDVKSLYGVMGSNSKYLSTADRWATNDSWTTDSVELVQYERHKEYVLRIYTAPGGAGWIERRLLDDTLGPKLTAKTLAQVGTYGTGWVDGPTQPGIWQDDQNVWHLGGTVRKESDVDPVDGEVIFTFTDSAVQPNTAPTIRPVVTGDADGRELGMLEYNAAGGGYQLVWRGGRTSDPVVKQPYVMLDGYSVGD